MSTGLPVLGQPSNSEASHGATPSRLDRDITSEPSERKDRFWTSMDSERKNREYV